MKISLKMLLLSTVSAVALAGGNSLAADLPIKAPAMTPPPPPAALWAGPYVGVNIGAARHDWTFTDLSPVPPAFVVFPGWDSRKTGLAAGVQAGYNWQLDRYVYGFEADINWLDVGKSQTPLPFANGGFVGIGGIVSASTDIDWLSTFRVRAGITGSPTLYYLTGGLAVAKVSNGWTAESGKASRLSKTKTGWTGGAGVEHMFGPNWTGRVEVRYTDLGKSEAPNVGVLVPGTATRFENKLIEVRAGLNFKW